MDVSENNGTPKSSILIGFSIINHPFGVPLFCKHPYHKQHINLPLGASTKIPKTLRALLAGRKDSHDAWEDDTYAIPNRIHTWYIYHTLYHTSTKCNIRIIHTGMTMYTMHQWDGMGLYTLVFCFFCLFGSFFSGRFQWKLRGWLICFRGLYLYGCVTNPHCIGCRVGQGDISGQNCEKRGGFHNGDKHRTPIFQHSSGVNSVHGGTCENEAIILGSLGLNGCSGIWSVKRSGCRGYVN